MREGVIRALRKFTVSLPYAEDDYGFDLSEAGTGEEALEIIDRTPPDILLLDYKLPGIKGLDVLDHIAQRQLDILTVMITAYASLETAVSATRYGAYDFLAKPFTPEELRTAVQKATKHLVLSRQARKLSEEKRRVRFEFISVLAHELKSPLAAVEGYLRIIESKAAGDNVAAYDRMVSRSIDPAGGDAEDDIRHPRPDAHRVGPEEARAGRVRHPRGGVGGDRDRAAVGAGAGNRGRTARAGAGPDDGGPKRTRHRVQQPGVERGEVQPRRGPRRPDAGQPTTRRSQQYEKLNE